MELPVNQIICGDCLEVMGDWEAGTVPIICTDPPYNIGKKYDGYSDDMPDEAYWVLMEQWVHQWYRVMGDGYLYCSHSDKGIYRLKPIIERAGFTYIQTLIWSGRNGYSMQLHRRSWSYRHEPIIFAMKGNPPELSAGEAGDWYTSVIEVPRPQSNFREGRCHPTQKPVLLYYRLLKRTPGELVVDPFVRSGTTCVAAEVLGKKWIGIENSEQYAAKARERIEAGRTGVPMREIGQMALPY